MSYQLYRTDHVGAAPDGPALGDYPDFDAALAARDRDVLTQLRAQPVPPREISHVIVGPGPRGPHTGHPVVTFAGADVTDPHPAAEITAVAAWLSALRAR